MKFLQQLDVSSKIAKSVTRQYQVATQQSSFAALLDALQMEGLIGQPDRIRLPEGYLWSDHRGRDGVMITTNTHPSFTSNTQYVVTASGSRDALDVFETVLSRHAKIINETVDPEALEINVDYHTELNPTVWMQTDGQYVLKPEVKRALKKIAKDFVANLDIPKLPIEDITITGSSANYNWTQSSDIDLHIGVDVAEGEKLYGSLFEDFLTARGVIWNEKRDVKIGTLPVELYVHDFNDDHVSSGVYSLTNDKWIVEPTYSEPTVDDRAVRQKLAKVMADIDEVVRGCNKAAPVEQLIQKIKTMRQSGLDKGGEFAVENIVFKLLRRNGYLEKLFDCRDRQYDRALSVEEEEWWK